MSISLALYTQGKTAPLCVTGPARFSWIMESDEADIAQVGRRVTLWRLDARGDRERVWDSGAQASGGQEMVCGAALRADARYEWQLELALSVGGAPRAVSGSARFETGLFAPEDWRAGWLGEQKKGEHHAFRRAFALPEGRRLAAAKLYVCGLGHFKAYINGADVTDAVLETAWTNYDKTCPYSAYDVTPLLREEGNVLGVIPGDGMFNVTDEGYAYYPRSYGLPRFLARLGLDFADGGRMEVASGEGWEMAASPFL